MFDVGMYIHTAGGTVHAGERNAERLLSQDGHGWQNIQGAGRPGAASERRGNTLQSFTDFHLLESGLHCLICAEERLFRQDRDGWPQLEGAVRPGTCHCCNATKEVSISADKKLFVSLILTLTWEEIAFWR